ncbi:hypothetical protein Arad_4251 [Rhizobium rhizogenes K84]|uniref:Uncharacterized protein n=1 Tax=Rhizobium rhizogenes (strain K84 / ATCC BAA-868) TaxID=311403 RepID=B9JBU9_RHIR8|nr:hypothetical protein Arad_4251 [Rhizobium rhizogenes K84]
MIRDRYDIPLTSAVSQSPSHRTGSKNFREFADSSFLIVRYGKTAQEAASNLLAARRKTFFDCQMNLLFPEEEQGAEAPRSLAD